MADNNWNDDFAYRGSERNFDRPVDRDSQRDPQRDGGRGERYDRPNDRESRSADRQNERRDWRSYGRNDDRDATYNQRSFNPRENYEDQNYVGSRSFDWGSPTYGSRDLNDRSFGRDWDRGSNLGYGNDYPTTYQRDGMNQLPNQQMNRPDYSRDDYSAGTRAPRANDRNRNSNSDASFGNTDPARYAGLGSSGTGIGFGSPATSTRDQNQAFAGNTGRQTPDYTGRGPKGYRRSDERIKEDVSDMLERHPDIDASEIELDVKDGVVFLRGAIEHRLQKRMAEDLIETVNGVKDIRNELVVNQSLFDQAKELLTGEVTQTKASDTSKSKPAPARH